MLIEHNKLQEINSNEVTYRNKMAGEKYLLNQSFNFVKKTAKKIVVKNSYKLTFLVSYMAIF